MLALACIVGGAYLFVGAVEHLATTLGVSELLLALVIAPIATELPEKFNSLIWVRQGKDTLAMGNITGAMVFQSAIPTVVALVFAGSAWHISEDSLLAFLSAGIAFLAVAAIFGPMWRRGTLDGTVAARRRPPVPRLPRARRPRRSPGSCRSADGGRSSGSGPGRCVLESAEEPSSPTRPRAARDLEPADAHPAVVTPQRRPPRRPHPPGRSTT